MSGSDPLAALAEAMRNVRMAYDRYFMGLERLEPAKERDATKKTLQRLMGETQRNTANKFRLQTLQASWNTWEAHWARIARQIEEGTFKRDKQKAIGKYKAMTPDGPGAPDALAADAKAAAPSAQVVAPHAATAGTRQAARVSDQTASQLHRDFEAARRSLGLPPGGLSLAALTQTLHKQAQAIVTQYKCQSVEFKVAIKDGKPILKATPR